MIDSDVDLHDVNSHDLITPKDPTLEEQVQVLSEVVGELALQIKKMVAVQKLQQRQIKDLETLIRLS